MPIKDAFEKSWINSTRCTKDQSGVRNMKKDSHSGAPSREGEAEDGLFVPSGILGSSEGRNPWEAIIFGELGLLPVATTVRWIQAEKILLVSNLQSMNILEAFYVS